MFSNPSRRVVIVNVVATVASNVICVKYFTYLSCLYILPVYASDRFCFFFLLSCCVYVRATAPFEFEAISNCFDYFCSVFIHFERENTILSSVYRRLCVHTVVGTQQEIEKCIALCVATKITSSLRSIFFLFLFFVVPFLVLLFYFSFVPLFPLGNLKDMLNVKTYTFALLISFLHSFAHFLHQ